MKNNIVKKLLASTLLGVSFISFDTANIVKAEACEECNYYSYEGWNFDGVFWQYYDCYGNLTIGWFYDGYSWYYFDDYGDMVVGWCYDSWGDWYYFDENGAMATGWRYLGGNWYYFNIYSGIMEHDTYIDGYYLDHNGVWSY
ncbi:hypothetical protein [uncultured Clostridium sp.]|uniref:hypothetical protein n=1 Tax=uncultured Clostridium sp. TaxID=59620 RepID=UPI0025D574D5|nr:hypothetical protein [uncultured Clostridium sp.]